MPAQRAILSTLDALGALIAVVDDDGKVLWVNSALSEACGARRWVGHGLAESLQQPLAADLLQRAHDAQAATISRGLQATLDGSRALRIDLRVSPMEAKDRHFLAELQLSAANTDDRNSAFGRMVAHEVRNPLGAIRGAAQLLARAAKRTRETELAQLIVEETDRIDNLVSQLHGGPTVSQPVLLNIHQVTEHVCQLAQAEFSGQLHVRRDYDPSLPELPLDHPRLVQALLNLVRNAAQSGARQVIMRTRADHHQRIGGQMQRLLVRVEIEDDGPGIPSDIQGQITQTGFSARAGGSGLGLTVVDSVAREHGGELAFDSRPGHTRFWLKLPLGAQG